ncbi:hypothetical protein EK21DRAFT_68717 [Setomelanomma holmii]|uniref:Uncharacterized protein n=1 Tax=Setomelanomma holmii TaxID=210430 RepID=A0A9P4H742_9PLEO|nr:hypothetical protein EK21DRAFT_68717 [Setomelanomma holmii]
MDKNGVWKVKINVSRTDQAAKVGWTLMDPNGNQAGSGTANSEDKKDLFFYVEAQNRPIEHHMPFGVNGFVNHWPNFDDTVVQLEIRKNAPDCDWKPGSPCKPKMTTENRLETQMFQVESCYQFCPKGSNTPLKPSDLNCEDLNDADWYDVLDGAKHRDFECHWKGF